MTSAPFLADLAKVRGSTCRHLAEAAKSDGATARRNTLLRLLNDLLANELIWLMRYRRRSLLWGRQDVPSEESTPADVLARRIVELGGEPDLDPHQILSRSRADYASRGSVTQMIREDLRAERLVIASYAEVIRHIGTTDPTTQGMLEVALDRERTREAELSQILRDLDRQAHDAVG